MRWLTEWQAAWEAVGAEADQCLLEDLLARYREPQRAYHTLQHLSECLENSKQLHHLAERPGEVAIALWFHDAIYDVRRDDNESRSAVWARTSLLAAGASASSAERVHALVMATRHDARPYGNDAEVLVDIDLWILGAPAARFAEYERQIRTEYGWVPDFLYRRERRKVLEAFAARARIFHTPLFLDQYELQARANIEWSLQALSG